MASLCTGVALETGGLENGAPNPQEEPTIHVHISPTGSPPAADQYSHDLNIIDAESPLRTTSSSKSTTVAAITKLNDNNDAANNNDENISIDNTNSENISIDNTNSKVVECKNPLLEVKELYQEGEELPEFATDEEDDPPPSLRQVQAGASTSIVEEEPNPRTTTMNGWRQLVALTEKNLIIKLRSPFSTLLELLIPLVFSSILIISFRMSDNVNDKAREYSTLAFNLPGYYIQTAVDALLRNKQGPLLTKSHNARNRRFLESLGMGPIRADTFLGGSSLSNTNSELAIKAKQLADGIYNLLTHPLPIPSLTQYVTLATGIEYGTKDLRSSKLFSLIEQSDYGATLYNLIHLGTLHLSPEGPTVTKFLNFINDTYPSVFNPIPFIQNLTNSSSPLLHTRVHKSTEEALSYIRSSTEKEPTWALIDMSNTFPVLSLAMNNSNTSNHDDILLNKADLDNVTFTIRMNSKSIPKTSKKATFFNPIFNTDYQMYYLSGFLTLQNTLEEFTFSQASSVLNSAAANPSSSESIASNSCHFPNSLRLWSMPMPTPQYNINVFFASNGNLMALMIAMGFLYPMSRLVKSIVEEKELRIKQTLLILGVKPWAYFSSWMIVAYMVFLLGSLLLSFMLHFSIITFSSLGYIFALVALFCSATIGFSFFIASFFSKAKLASLVGPMALFVTLFPYFLFFGTNQDENVLAKKFASLFPCTAFSFGFNILAAYELGEVGVHFWNASEGGYSFNVCLALLAFDTVLYIFLAWYFDQIIPSTYGVRRPFYFCLKPSYWGWERNYTASTEDEVSPSTLSNPGNGNFEIIEGKECGQPKVVIKGLVKRYKKKGPNVVDHLNLKLYENQITCLLGHNGAGKTTTISVLTGLIPATHGECVIYGKSVSSEMDTVRQSMGICPQHDVLFSDLTVAEHLKLFDQIKGVTVTAQSIQKRAEKFGLEDKVNALSCHLSGGMKRKLSIAIAFCGDSKFILLDEPTTGMDPYARRSTWEMLRKSKKDRVILLTTHFMDEAEILSDHIAVMKSGHLQCFGSPLFLKKAFGLGYTLTVVLSDSRCISGPDSDNGKGNSASQLKEDISSDGDLKIKYASETVDGETNQPQSDKTQENVEKVVSGSSNVVSKNGTNLDSADGRRLSIELRRERPHLDQCFPSQIISFDEDRSAAQLKESTLFCGSNSRGTHVSDVNNEEMPQPPTRKSKHNIEVDYGGIFKPGASSGMDMVLMDEIDLSTVLELENGLGPQLFSNSLNSHDGKTSGTLVTEFISTLSSDSTVKWVTKDKGTTLTKPQAERFKHNIDVSCGDQHDNIVEDFINSRHSPNEFELENELGLQLQQFSPKLDSKALQCNKAMCDYNKNNHALGLPMQAHMNRIDSEANAGQEILRFLQHFVPETQLLRYSGREVMFRLPNGNENNFPALFEAFDDARMRERIRIGGYGITNSSLEEVFLLLAEDFAEIGLGINELQANLENPLFSTTRAASQYRDEDRSQHSCVSDSITSLSDVKCEWESVRVGFLGQMVILLRKRFTIQRRDIKGFLSIILVPFLAISLMLLILTVNLGPTGPPIQMSLDLYKNLPFGAENKAFSVLLGNGSSLQKNDTSILDLKDFLSLNSHFVDAYEAQDIGSSTVMSSYLLKTQGNNTKAARLCSYVVGDRINILVNMNWDQFWKLMQEANLMNYVNYTLLSSLLTSQPKGKSLSQRNLEAPDQNLESLAIGSLDAFDITHNGIVAKEILLNLQENGIDVSQLTNTLPPTGKPLTFHEVVNMIKKWPTGKAKYDIGVDTSVTILHNTTSPHAVAVFNHEYANSRYKQCTGNGTINIVNHPLPISTKKSIENRSILSIFAVLSTLIPLCFVPSALIVFVVKEKGCKSKHVQLVSGVRLSSFWIANYIWDMMMYSVLVALVMATLAFYGPNSAQVFMGDTASVFATAFLFFGYGVSALPFAYLICRTHESSSDAQISVLCWFFITGFMTLTTYGILLTTESTAYAATALKPFFQLFPAFNVGDGLLNLCLSFYERQISGKDSLPFNWNVAGGPIFLLFILSLPYFCLLLMLECSETGGTGGVFGHMLRKSRNFMNDAILKCSGISLNSDGELILDDSGGIEDDDVAFERNRVIQNEAALKSSAKILMVDLWKIYPAWGSVILKLFKNLLWSKCVSRNNSSNNRECHISDLSKQAVRGLTLAIEKGETFGLLGANGAGKSTTMAILTGDTTASLGEAYVSGYDVTGCTAAGVSKARKRIGFCPQVDPLLDLMTGRETLHMFGLLRGIPRQNLEAAVEDLLCALTLSKHADQIARTYSGGNKRKLSLGVALIGSPDVILIDESSSGMDPYARRKIWDLISEVAETRMVVLTTHSMEEAEALCTRLTIMVDGKMKCIGSVQHLKSKYLGGYTLDLQLQSSATATILETVKRHILEIALPSSLLVEEHGLFLRFSIPSLNSEGVSLSLGSIFSSLEAMKSDESMLLQEYSIAQSTLEQVFINLTKEG